jgi:hypothetical protein
MSSTTNVAILTQIENNKDKILNGTVLVIDPASNIVGYALYIKGKLELSGKVMATAKAPIHQRLKEIVSRLPKVTPDVLGIELVRTTTGHVFMVWAVGAILAHYGVPTIELPHRMWKEVIDEHYEKDDTVDAIYMGKFMLAKASGSTVILKR